MEVGEARFRTNSRVMASNPVWAQRGEMALTRGASEGDEVVRVSVWNKRCSPWLKLPLSSFSLLLSQQPTTFLRVALLIIRNAALDNPAAGFLQSILTTELAYTAFTNVFASFAAGVVQDFSQVGGAEGWEGSRRRTTGGSLHFFGFLGEFWFRFFAHLPVPATSQPY